MRLWTEGIVSRVKAFLPAGGRKTVVMAAAGRLWLAEMEKGKYLVKKSAALPKITEESLDNGGIPCGSVFLLQRHRGTRNNLDL